MAIAGGGCQDRHPARRSSDVATRVTKGLFLEHKKLLTMFVADPITFESPITSLIKTKSFEPPNLETFPSPYPLSHVVLCRGLLLPNGSYYTGPYI